MEDPLNHTVRASVMIKLMIPAHTSVQVIIDKRRAFIRDPPLCLVVHHIQPHTMVKFQCPLQNIQDTEYGTQTIFHRKVDIENGQYQT